MCSFSCSSPAGQRDAHEEVDGLVPPLATSDASNHSFLGCGTTRSPTTVKMQMNAEDEPQLGDLDSLLMSLNSSSDDAETICVDDLLVDEEGLPLALDEETRKARRMARNRRAAAESRDRKKRRVDELEGQVEVLERENSAPARLACAPPPLTGALPPL